MHCLGLDRAARQHKNHRVVRICLHAKLTVGDDPSRRENFKRLYFLRLFQFEVGCDSKRELLWQLRLLPVRLSASIVPAGSRPLRLLTVLKELDLQARLVLGTAHQ